MRRRFRFMLLLSAIGLLTSLWSYAYGASSSASGDEAIQIEAAEPAVAPGASFFGGAIGGVTPGDLFYIDASGEARDITVNLYLTNADGLVHYLRYLILEVSIYYENRDGQWQKTPLRNSQPAPDTFLTLRNSPVSFTLAGYTRYKVTIDAGSFYCLPANGHGDNPAPQFYLTVEPA